MVDLPSGFRSHRSSDGRRAVAFLARDQSSEGHDITTKGVPQLLVLGDDFELESRQQDGVMGNATTLEIDLERGRCEAVVALPGLPALYVLETPESTVVTSDPFLLRHVEGLALRFDPDGVSDLAQVGHPVAYRTLFRGLRMVAGGSRLEIASSGALSTRVVWSPPARDPMSSWDEYTAVQAETFGEAMSRLVVRSCQFSLSSGLDSRATLAGLLRRGASVRALTVSGENPCLDARTAARLCAAYGIEHQTIVLGETFRRNLPELSAKASLLSGGINSLSHAAQVHCYGTFGDPPPFNALSGYLGNQTGRLGTEGLTPRGAGVGLIDPSLGLDSDGDPTSWYRPALQDDGLLETAFLIQQESTFGNLAAYQVGNSYSVQQSGYAYRPLIENMWRLPDRSTDARVDSLLWNLKHRFLGEPLDESFQRRYINEVGGLVATYPINWGWRSKGGVSLPGVWRGGLSLIDAYVSSRHPEGMAARVTQKLGIAGMEDFRPVHDWLRFDMKEFVSDTLLAENTRTCGLFDLDVLSRTHEIYHREGRGLGQIQVALDLALAAQNFGATA
jgi:hypothetical protein